MLPKAKQPRMNEMKMAVLKSQTGDTGHDMIAKEITSDQNEQKMIKEQLNAISQDFSNGKITREKKLELKEAILTRTLELKEAILTRTEPFLTSAPSDPSEQPPPATLECAICFDDCNVGNSVTCQQGHTICNDEACLIQHVRLSSFDDFETAVSEGFDFNRLLRTKGEIICPGCITNYSSTKNSRNDVNSAHLLPLIDVIKILPTDVGGRYLTTLRYVAQQSKIVEDHRDAMERMVAKIDPELVSLNVNTDLIQLQRRRNELKMNDPNAGSVQTVRLVQSRMMAVMIWYHTAMNLVPEATSALAVATLPPVGIVTRNGMDVYLRRPRHAQRKKEMMMMKSMQAFVGWHTITCRQHRCQAYVVVVQLWQWKRRDLLVVTLVLSLQSLRVTKLSSCSCQRAINVSQMF